MIKVRHTKIKDLKFVKIIDELAFGKDSYPLFVLRQYHDISTDLFLVAEEANNIVGYTIGHLDSKTKIGWVLSLGVHPQKRGKKLGEILTKKLVELIEINGASEILLTVHPDNKAAMKIYKKIGFAMVDKCDDYYLDKEERIIMKKACAEQSIAVKLP